MDIISLLIACLVTAVSLLIISKLPTGVEIDSFEKALVSAVVFGILNALLKPILIVLSLPLTILTVGLFAIVVNAIIFGLAAALVTGFRLRWGFWSALIGAIALGFVNSLIYKLLGTLA
ncbi:MULTISPECIES: phage holin family protein [Moorena]|uniref:Putative membrane protein n=1 Tax=Moorena producens 3L TaxID=489825 RepID=F4XYK6_9CYAN|nr:MULTISPECIES: phage holin family protein [Moorena]NES84869.1 phage holin family protein [Moorena sp. SIO2B7]EGJ30419.1 putative membrane protein [Moorena producens 3L]NEP36398.1 phage holin family protein [Moorena sp. SIO3B2]NEP68071.1 phage holin family protein [Moorena sp. SIO3A5]NEQ06283.1 phage holin family protein [Moorena sp. SIO4E2]